MKYNGTTYYYITNIQGDVLKIVNSSGTAVATYTYNAWGELLSSSGSLAAVNPIRYRSYYYDAETGFYYLQSRYYDPVICRFINADDVTMLGANGDFSSVNLFAYCGNNPIKNRDDAGTFFFTALGAVSGFIGGAVSALVMGEDFATAMEQGCAGAVGGAIAGAGVDAGLLLFSLGGPVSVVAAVGIAYFAGGFGNVVTTAISSEGKASGVEYVGAFIIGGTFNVLSLGTSLECAGKTLGDIALKGALSAQENMVVGTMISTASGVATSIGSAALKRADSVNRQGMVRMAQ